MPWVLKDLGKTCAAHYDDMPESSIEILGHSVGGVTYRHYAHRARWLLGQSIPWRNLRPSPHCSRDSTICVHVAEGRLRMSSGQHQRKASSVPVRTIDRLPAFGD